MFLRVEKMGADARRAREAERAVLDIRQASIGTRNEADAVIFSTLMAM